MRSVNLGSQGLKVSAEGLGCMGMSSVYGPSDDTESLATLARARELGITLFDTAEVYGPYSNETLLGKAFAGHRSEVLLSTKLGFVIAPDGTQVIDATGTPALDSSPEHLTSAIEGSLSRLNTDYVDLVYLHRIDPAIPIEDSIGALSELVSAGKVRFIGISEASADTIRRAHAVHALTAVQTEYSLFERGVETNDVLSTVKELGIGFVSYSPLGRGFLTGTIANTASLDAADFRRFDPRLQGEHLDQNLAVVAAIREVAEKKGVKPSQLAIAWTISQGTVPIPGTRRVHYIEENAAAADIELTPADLEQLNSAAPIGSVSGERYSTSLLDQLGR